MSTHYFKFDQTVVLGRAFDGNFIDQRASLVGFDGYTFVGSVPVRADSARLYCPEGPGREGLWLDLTGVSGDLCALISIYEDKCVYVIQFDSHFRYIWLSHGIYTLTEITESIPLSSAFE